MLRVEPIWQPGSWIIHDQSFERHRGCWGLNSDKFSTQLSGTSKRIIESNLPQNNVLKRRGKLTLIQRISLEMQVQINDTLLQGKNTKLFSLDIPLHCVRRQRGLELCKAILFLYRLFNMYILYVKK